MSDEFETKLLVEAGTTREALRPDIIKIEDMIRLHRSRLGDILDLELKRKITQYIEQLQYALQSLEDILKYIRSY